MRLFLFEQEDVRRSLDKLPVKKSGGKSTNSSNATGKMFTTRAGKQVPWKTPEELKKGGNALSSKNRSRGSARSAIKNTTRRGSSDKPLGRDECRICHATDGHWEKDCPQRPKGNGGEKKGGKAFSASSSKGANNPVFKSKKVVFHDNHGSVVMFDLPNLWLPSALAVSSLRLTIGP